MDDLAKLEDQAEQYARDGDAQAAVKCFYDLVAGYARAKNFPKAEALRERLMAVDDMALTEIIKTAEIIEAEKSNAIDQDHVNAFKTLYDTLTEEESNALYFAQEPLVLEAGEVLYRQGDVNTRLFFILQGHLKLYFSREGKDNLIATLEQGAIAGQDSFFGSTLCTTSLAVHSGAELQVIERQKVAAWKESVPALEAKLQQFCHKQDVGQLVTTERPGTTHVPPHQSRGPGRGPGAGCVTATCGKTVPRGYGRYLQYGSVLLYKSHRQIGPHAAGACRCISSPPWKPAESGKALSAPVSPWP